MNILHIADSIDPNTGGPPRVLARMAGGQALLGHRVSVVSYKSVDGEARIISMLRSIPGVGGVKFIYLEPPSPLEKVFANRTRRRLAELLKGTDIVNLHGFWSRLYLTAAAESRSLKIPYIVQPDGMLDPWSLSQKKFKKRLALKLIFRDFVNQSAALFLGNAEEARLIEPLGFPAQKYVIPLNSIFLEEMEPLPAANMFFDNHKKLNGHPFILFVGRLHYKKGLDILGKAFSIFAAKNPNVHLVIIGHDEGAQNEFEQHIAAAGLTDRVHLLGAQHDLTKWQAYRDASCYVLPSRQEGFSISITEALACGLPAVITDACHFDEVAEVGAGCVVGVDPDQVAEAFEHIFADRKLQISMSVAARKLVNEKYSGHEMANQTINAYADVMRNAKQ